MSDNWPLIPVPAHCDHMTYPETLETPAEYCEEEAVDGADFCELHLDDHDE